MKKRTEIILKIMNVFAWFAYIGLMVKAGALLFVYCYTVVRPDAAIKFYEGQNLYSLRVSDFWNFTVSVALRAAIPVVEAYTAFLVIKVLSKIKLSNPFTMEIAHLMEKISYYILAAWIIVVIYNSHTAWLVKHNPGLPLTEVSGDFIFLAGIVFVFAQIFKKGVELQTENELTV